MVDGLKMDILAMFKGIMLTKHAAASISRIPANRFASNARIIVPVDNVNQATGEGVMILKLTQVHLATIPRTRFTPIIMTTDRKNFCLVGTRLSQHGGEIAVELARKIVKKASMKLVVLDTNIVAFHLLDMSAIISAPVNGKINAIPGQAVIESWFSALRDVSDDFHARVSSLITSTGLPC
jgi:hypothetical protein